MSAPAPAGTAPAGPGEARPEHPWVLRQTWRDVLFLHWPAPAELLLSLLPAPLELDTHAGLAWISIVPFRIEGCRVRGLPPLPGLRQSAELNLRTYVRLYGQPGVHFLTLEAENRLFVAGGRLAFHLPYHHACMLCRSAGGRVDFESVRRASTTSFVAFTGSYEPCGPAAEAPPGSLEHFLAERYSLFAEDRRGRIHRADIRHAPWRLQPARARIQRNTLPEAYGLAVAGDPLLHYAARQDVLFLGPRRVHP